MLTSWQGKSTPPKPIRGNLVPPRKCGVYGWYRVFFISVYYLGIRAKFDSWVNGCPDPRLSSVGVDFLVGVRGV